MELLAKCAKGTKDILPNESYKWHFLQSALKSEAEKYGFKEITTPVFEYTELFKRSVGENTDIVQKEMYTFEDKGGRYLTLRPEGTVGVVRAVLEHGLFNETLPLKTYYIQSFYRYEKPQLGRFREFHQFGAEVFGPSSYLSDAEIITLGMNIFKKLDLQNVELQINSIGCQECRKKYYEELKNYFEIHKDKVCTLCFARLERNPMRVLDCKNSDCQEIINNTPSILDYICPSCRKNFENLQQSLNIANIKYKINHRIVRGLDYYSGNVFEFICLTPELAGLALGGGGRYDNLIKEIGKKELPALGFGLGVERILTVLEKEKIEIPKPKNCEIFLASIGEKSNFFTFDLANKLHKQNVYVQNDIMDRSLKNQIKYADKIRAKYMVIIGENEINTKTAKIKEMETGTEAEIKLETEDILKFLKENN